MANEQLKRLFRRGPEINVADFELLQSRVQARLRASGPGPLAPEDDANGDLGGSVATAVADDEPTDLEAGAPPAADGPVDAPPGPGRYLAIRATTYELPDNAVGVMADAKGSIWAPSDAAPAGEPSPSIDAPVGTRTPKAAKARAPKAKSSTARAPKATAPKATAAKARPATAATPTVKMRSARSKRSTTRTTMRNGPDPAPEATHVPAARTEGKAMSTAARPAPAKRRQAAQPSAVRTIGVPYCPYCATLLDPAPQADRRCPRCRERIIVKRVDGRAVYLTEASVAVFEAERLRLTHAARWNRERQRWLAAAGTVGASADRIKRLEAASITEAVVEASRALYATTVERGFRLAQRERRWEDASRTMRDHAVVLFRIAGSPVPPPEEVLRPHRDGAAAALRGLGGMAREAELLGAKCCDACRADDGRTFPIAAELRTSRLPHAGCPKGLCKCDWYLAVRDESLVRRHLRRRKRVDGGQPPGA